MKSIQESTSERTTIYRFRSSGEDPVGYVAADGIFRIRWETGIRIGRIERDADSWRILRDTRYDEKEVGAITNDGMVHSHGLFEGGSLGWLEPDGTVVQSGLIFIEEEIGRVEGAQPEAAAAALLLIFVPEEDEADREMKRRG